MTLRPRRERAGQRAEGFDQVTLRPGLGGAVGGFAGGRRDELERRLGERDAERRAGARRGNRGAAGRRQKRPRLVSFAPVGGFRGDEQVARVERHLRRRREPVAGVRRRRRGASREQRAF